MSKPSLSPTPAPLDMVFMPEALAIRVLAVPPWPSPNRSENVAHAANNRPNAHLRLLGGSSSWQSQQTSSLGRTDA